MIESINNDRIKEYTKLNDKKYRKINKLFIASGEHLVFEAMKKGIVKEIFAVSSYKSDFNVTYVTDDVMKKLSALDTPPKVLAICNMLESKEISSNVVILDNIKDPGNLGTIIRSAVAFGYTDIILSPECVDIYNNKVIRATEGMLFNINVIIGSIEDNLKRLKKLDYKIFGTDVNGGVLVNKCTDKHAIIIGSEAKGMDEKYKELCDEMLYIKMNEACESLNAGVSASILMYELSK